MRRCAHFTGSHLPNCAVGIPYDLMRRKCSTDTQHWPCLNRESGFVCHKARYPNVAEAEESLRLVDTGWERAVAALCAIMTRTNGNRTGHGEITCPNCRVGRLRYAFSPNNRHLRAQCSTENCTAVVE